MSSSRPEIGELFERYGTDVLRVVYAATGRHDVADDIVQEVFLQAHDQRHKLVAGPRIRVWLLRVAMNLVRNHWRSRTRYRRILERFQRDVPRAPAASPEESVARRRAAVRVQACIMRIPETYREVFVLYELQGLSGEQISEALQIPVGTVWTRLHRARAAFRAHGTRVAEAQR